MTKNRIRELLRKLKLLAVVRKVIYWFTQFDPNSTNPQRRIINFYSQFIKKNDLCFDIGASFGNRTKVFLELGAKVVCVEAEKESLKRLKRLYGKNKKVSVVAKGVADRPGILPFWICKEYPQISTMSETYKQNCVLGKNYGYHWDEVDRITIVTLDNLISEFGLPNFCKIDVEGFEAQVLSGLTKPIPFLSFEFNSPFFGEIRNCVNRIIQVGNYRFNFALGEPTGPEGLVLKEWVEPEELYKSMDLAKKKNAAIWGDIYAGISERI